MQNMSSSAASLSRMAHHSPPDLGSLLPLGANNMCRAWYCKLPQSYQANISRINTMPAFNKAVCNQQASRDSAETHLAESRGARNSVNLFWADFPRHSLCGRPKQISRKPPFLLLVVSPASLKIPSPLGNGTVQTRSSASASGDQ